MLKLKGIPVTTAVRKIGKGFDAIYDAINSVKKGEMTAIVAK